MSKEHSGAKDLVRRDWESDPNLKRLAEPGPFTAEAERLVRIFTGDKKWLETADLDGEDQLITPNVEITQTIYADEEDEEGDEDQVVPEPIEDVLGTAYFMRPAANLPDSHILCTLAINDKDSGKTVIHRVTMDPRGGVIAEIDPELGKFEADGFLRQAVAETEKAVKEIEIARRKKIVHRQNVRAAIGFSALAIAGTGEGINLILGHYDAVGRHKRERIAAYDKANPQMPGTPALLGNFKVEFKPHFIKPKDFKQIPNIQKHDTLEHARVVKVDLEACDFIDAQVKPGDQVYVATESTDPIRSEPVVVFPEYGELLVCSPQGNPYDDTATSREVAIQIRPAASG